MIIDNWIELRVSPRTAVLFKALRKQLFEMMAARIAAGHSEDASAAWSPPSASTASASAPQPGGRGWPPPMETREQAQSAVLASLVWLIGKGMELQADELAAAALSGSKRAPARR